MPIKSLMRRDSASFPPIGKLRKGGKKQAKGDKEIMGKDLDHFRFDSEDPDAMSMFERVYGLEPKQVKIYLVDSAPEQVFQFWKEEYRSGNLIHRCDGETCVLWRKPDGTFSQEPKPCPGNCKQVGRLKVIIPALMRFAYVTVETHSVHDIIQLQENLAAAYSLFGDLSRIPFTISRRKRELSYIGTDGKPHKITKSLLYLEPDPEMMEIRMLALERERQQVAGLLPERPLLVDKTTGEIMDDDDEEEDYMAVTHKGAIAKAVEELFGDTLNESSQALFVGYLATRYTKAATPSSVRNSEAMLTQKESEAVAKALRTPTKAKEYFNDFKKGIADQAVAEDEAAQAAKNKEAAEAQALAESVGAVIQVPEGELVAA